MVFAVCSSKVRFPVMSTGNVLLVVADFTNTSQGLGASFNTTTGRCVCVCVCVLHCIALCCVIECVCCVVECVCVCVCVALCCVIECV